VALRSEFLALVLGLSGSLAFLLILTSRRDELASLRSDLQQRLVRGRQERFAAKVTYEAIQRIELCERASAVRTVLEDTTRTLGCDVLSVTSPRDGQSALGGEDDRPPAPALTATVSGRTATFRLSSGQDFSMIVSLHQATESSLPADIAFRFLQRLSIATVERLDWILAGEHAGEAACEPEVRSAELAEEPWAALAVSPTSSTHPSRNWLRAALGGRGTRPAPARPSLGDE
jgi:UDP-GlcNAc:undecaprenyl-phosphate GlcNAc-1-phosphate transferase